MEVGRATTSLTTLLSRDSRVKPKKPRGRHLQSDGHSRPGSRSREPNLNGHNGGRHSRVSDRRKETSPSTVYVGSNLRHTNPIPASPKTSSPDPAGDKPPNGWHDRSDYRLPLADTLSPAVRKTATTALTEITIRELWSLPTPDVSSVDLAPDSSHPLQELTRRRTRTGWWVILAVALVGVTAVLGTVLLSGGGSENQEDARVAVTGAALSATESVEESLATLESLRQGSSFTPDLVSSISALGAASRDLVESAGTISTTDPSLGELRMATTALAGRISRLGATFGAAFSYRGQVAPHLGLPELDAPLDILNLSENTALLTDWQFRLEQAAAIAPNHPRLLENQQALEAALPHIAVNRQAYSEAMGTGRSEEATTALSQISSLLAAISEDFDQAFGEIATAAETEIRSLLADLQNL